MNPPFTSKALALLGFFTGLTSFSCLAATAEGNVAADSIQEVVVTATRRSERLQDVPISVSALFPGETGHAGS